MHALVLSPSPTGNNVVSDFLLVSAYLPFEIIIMPLKCGPVPTTEIRVFKFKCFAVTDQFPTQGPGLLKLRGVSYHPRINNIALWALIWTL